MAAPRPRPPKDGASSAAILSSGTDIDGGCVGVTCSGPLKPTVACPNFDGPVEVKAPNPRLGAVDPKVDVVGCPKGDGEDVDPKAGAVEGCPKEGTLVNTAVDCWLTADPKGDG